MNIMTKESQESIARTIMGQVHLMTVSEQLTATSKSLKLIGRELKRLHPVGPYREIILKVSEHAFAMSESILTCLDSIETVHSLVRIHESCTCTKKNSEACPVHAKQPSDLLDHEPTPI